MRSTIKVLVVDDSALIRQMLTRALVLDPRIEIVGVAKTGLEAIEKARTLQPDVITLDIEMPELSGLEALPHLARHTSARIVMLSSVDDPDTTYQALRTGAVDFIPKPKGGFASSLTELSETLLSKIKLAYRIDTSRFDPAVRVDAPGSSPLDTAPAEEPIFDVDAARATGIDSLVAIAASTGGPPALERVFAGLEAGLPAAYMVVQHLPAGFAESLARRLDSVSEIRVTVAQDGMDLEPATGYLAPYGTHMRLARRVSGTPRIELAEGPSLHGVRPSADPLFESVAREYAERSLGVVLTGMGTDGAQGLGSIREAGGDTIVQDERTSVVWGMPGAAVRMGAARHQVPIGLVAAEIRRVVRGGRAS